MMAGATPRRRTPGKPSRLDPTEPLHMTTRRAAKVPHTNGTPSANGSTVDSESQRGSFDDLRPASSYAGSPPSPKRRRTSNGSNSAEGEALFATRSPSTGSNVLATRSAERSPSVSDDPVVASKKRTYSTRPLSNASLATDGNANFDESIVQLTQTDDGHNIFVNGSKPVKHHNDEGDFVEVVPAEDLSSRRGSDSSEPSYAPARESVLLVAPSTDATPLPSVPGSPVTSESYGQGETPAKLTAVAPTPEVIGDEDLPAETQDPVDVEDAEEVEEAEYAVRSDDDDVPGRPTGRRRWAGRRRAAHPNARVEAAMRRQLELKVAYRSIARALKPALGELAQRSLDGLHADPIYHEKSTQHESVMARLDATLARRQAQIKLQAKSGLEQLRKTHRNEELARGYRAALLVDEIRDNHLIQMEREIVRIGRAAQMAEEDAGHETQQEDNDVTLRPKAAAYRYKRKGPLDLRHDSRSRFIVETEKVSDDMQSRQAMAELLRKHYSPEQTEGFTIMDSALREAASVNRDNINNTKILANAAAEVERSASLPPPSRSTRQKANRGAINLQLLADLATGHTPRLALGGQYTLEAGSQMISPATEPPVRRRRRRRGGKTNQPADEDRHLKAGRNRADLDQNAYNNSDLASDEQMAPPRGHREKRESTSNTPMSSKSMVTRKAKNAQLAAANENYKSSPGELASYGLSDAESTQASWQPSSTFPTGPSPGVSVFNEDRPKSAMHPDARADVPGFRANFRASSEWSQRGDFPGFHEQQAYQHVGQSGGVPGSNEAAHQPPPGSYHSSPGPMHGSVLHQQQSVLNQPFHPGLPRRPDGSLPTLAASKRSHSISEGTANDNNNNGYVDNEPRKSLSHSNTAGRKSKEDRNGQSRREYKRQEHDGVGQQHSSLTPLLQNPYPAAGSPPLSSPSHYGQPPGLPSSMNMGGWRMFPPPPMPTSFGGPPPPPPQAMPVNHFASVGMPGQPGMAHRSSFSGLPPPPPPPPPLHPGMYSPQQQQPLFPYSQSPYGPPATPYGQVPKQHPHHQQQAPSLPPAPMYGGAAIAPAGNPAPPAFAQGREGTTGGRRRHTEGGEGPPRYGQ